MLSILTNYFWYCASFLLIVSGLYYTVCLKFPQFRFKEMIKSLSNEKKFSIKNIFKKKKEGISPFQTLTLALAARIGVGSLSGIALGLLNGGPGVLFWIWISCIITLPNALVESSLAVKYRENDGDFYKGGPAYYIKKGLNKKTLAKIYAIVLSITYLFGFLSIQSNTISTSIVTIFPISKIIIGLIVSIITFIIIVKGLKGIADFTSKLVPIMGLLYMLLALIIILGNINTLPSILKLVIGSAFNVKTTIWGLISSVIIIGMQRGIFCTEAGIGTGAIASGTSDTDSPIKQGFLQMFGIYFTTFIVCTSTAIIVLSSGVLDTQTFINPNGIEITQAALNFHIGSIGNYILLLAIIAFAFSTIISGYYYGESNIKFLFKNLNKKTILIIKILVVGILFYGSIAEATILWNMVDLLVATLAIINIISILLLRKDTIKEYKYYNEHNK